MNISQLYSIIRRTNRQCLICGPRKSFSVDTTGKTKSHRKQGVSGVFWTKTNKTVIAIINCFLFLFRAFAISQISRACRVLSSLFRFLSLSLTVTSSPYSFGSVCLTGTYQKLNDTVCPCVSGFLMLRFSAMDSSTHTHGYTHFILF